MRGEELFGGPADLQDRDPVDLRMQAHPLIGPVALGPLMRGVGIQRDHMVAGQPCRPTRCQAGELVGDLRVQHDPVVAVQRVALAHHGSGRRLADLSGRQRGRGLRQLGQPDGGGELGARRAGGDVASHRDLTDHRQRRIGRPERDLGDPLPVQGVDLRELTGLRRSDDPFVGHDRVDPRRTEVQI